MISGDRWNRWVNPATYVAYIFLIGGVIFQIKTTYECKSVHDIAIAEIAGRFIAQIIIMWKMWLVKDRTLIVGHAVLTILYSVYFALVIKYRYFL